MSVGSPNNEERRLLAEYDTATQFYSWAVRELSRTRSTLSREEYDKLGTMVEDARAQCEVARLALAEFKKPGTQI